MTMASKKTQRFSPSQSLGSLDNTSIHQYLVDIDDVDSAEYFRDDYAAGHNLPVPLVARSWQHTGLAIGFIEPGSTRSADIVNALAITPDIDLIESRIKITFDKFFVHQYPGLGTHNILCEFAGKNQLPSEAEEMRFALNTSARDGNSTGIASQPIFMGVTVGADGISFEGRTVNVCSSADDEILKALDSPAFKAGLALVTSVQPALKPFTGLATSVVHSAASRARNKQVHSFNVGLDFSSTSTSAKMRLGSYLIVQTDGTNWSWSDFIWDCNSASLRHKHNSSHVLANYMVFGVSPFHAPATSPTTKPARKRSQANSS
ncbi:hypothetical protein BLA18628_05856 [Burkholderia aenigmatica]|nr:hypothetical protein BLA18628_05856 [Burkholderia aenigmatica]